VDSLLASRPLPSWFTSEIEPPASYHPAVSPSAVAGDAGSGGLSGGQQLAEALFDSARCGSGATLDPTRTRVDFGGMATVRFP
jgi:hypothetical protein